MYCNFMVRTVFDSDILNPFSAGLGYFGTKKLLTTDFKRRSRRGQNRGVPAALFLRAERD